MDRKRWIAWSLVGLLVVALLVVWAWPYILAGAYSPPVLPERPTKKPASPEILHAQKIVDHIPVRLLVLDDDRHIPYDKLLIYDHGAVVRNRDTGEEFIIILDVATPEPVMPLPPLVE